MHARDLEHSPIDAISDRLFVPPFIKTARAAVAWSFEMKERDYMPEVES